MSVPDDAVPAAVFAYGTLKRGERNFELAQRAGWLCSEPGWLEGFRLFHIPQQGPRPYGYPAIVPGEGRVQGEVQRFQDLEFALTVLDALEDEGQEYRRIPAVARTQSGAIWVWVYVYPSLEAIQSARGIPLRGEVWAERTLKT
ncbi:MULTISPECIES: gamma-glutamylcyclotransferase [unclassified Meiothermus]|uniref:gamma-glutamylcyclotransferase family protein n=1 Tax=unclassified Meiothermus TaxID=370471 RepID=UPI000D7C4AFC|nr:MULTISPECIES: gamma-glutamylcyclotransferase family protein [unclassified Meiothermus]PZA07946.1 gamma-glutamylcyclotransferase [Meiothermus sp. Pnk-1]RYM36709.1 gamma-glutamylcyclotransferase [Meiothermus sp. PNK-Is4]